MVRCTETSGAEQTLCVKYGLQHRSGAKQGNADALSRRPRNDSIGESQPTNQGQIGDNDTGGSGSGVEPDIVAPEYGDTEHGGGAGVVPKYPVSQLGASNVIAAHREQWVDPGHGWCRVVGTEDGPGEEPRLVEQLESSDEESGERQKVANICAEGQAPATPNISDAQLRDEDIALILYRVTSSQSWRKFSALRRRL